MPAKRPFPLAALLLGACLTSAVGRAAIHYVNNQSAVEVIGQSTLNSSSVNANSGVPSTGLALTPGATSSIWTDGTTLIVADTNNNRVLIWNSAQTGGGFPSLNGTPADVVIGQQDKGSNLANQGGAVGANTLSGPNGVFFDTVNSILYIADRGNNRVLVYLALPTADGASADLVVGQAAMTTSVAATSPTGLSSPNSVWVDAASLYVADQGNHRVLIYTLPVAGGDAAVIAVGQADLNTGTPNTGGRGANRVSAPAFVSADASDLYVADRGNNRVLIFNPIPAASNASASFVVGQGSMTAGLANYGRPTASSTTLSSPASVIVSSFTGKLLIADSGNNRVLIYSSLPTANNRAADIVVGQTTGTLNTANQGSSVKANTLSAPTGVASDATGTGLYVADQGNNRALVYNAIPTVNNKAADTVQGQLNLVTGSANPAINTPVANGLNRPGAARAEISGARLLIADRNNNRVLIYNAVPTANNASADVVAGQLVMSTGSANQGGPSPTFKTMNQPTDVQSDGTNAYVVDRSNNRVLVFAPVPGANGAAAAKVLGQTSFNTNGAGTTQSTLRFPTGAFAEGNGLGPGNRVFVADSANHRVLQYSISALAAPPTANNATGVAGQGGFVTGASGSGAGNLFFPLGVYSDGTNLYVADAGNNRVLVYTLPLAAGGTPASNVIGQANLGPGTNLANRGAAAPANNTLKTPTSVWSDGSALYVVDQGNNRVLIYSLPLPGAIGAATAAVVIGQSSFTTSAANQGGGAAPGSLASPVGVMVDSTTGRMFVADGNNNRTLLFLPATLSTVTTTGGTVTFTQAAPLTPASVQAVIPPSAFANPVSVTINALSGFAPANAGASLLQPTGVGAQISLNPAVQPNGLVTITITYQATDFPGVDRSKLIIARFDDLTRVWVPLVSVSDIANSRVVAQSDHFSTFQIMVADPSNNSARNVIAFPNPFRPSLRATAVMTFAQAPANARLRIYTPSGALIKDFHANATGLATWDGTNAAGVSVASGIYFVLVQGNGTTRTLSVAVSR